MGWTAPWNKGNSASGEPVREGDRCEGVDGNAAGMGYGKVESVTDVHGTEYARVKWDRGGTSSHQQWELRGTSIF